MDQNKTHEQTHIRDLLDVNATSKVDQSAAWLKQIDRLDPNPEAHIDNQTNKFGPLRKAIENGLIQNTEN